MKRLSSWNESMLRCMRRSVIKSKKRDTNNTNNKTNNNNFASIEATSRYR